MKFLIYTEFGRIWKSPALDLALDLALDSVLAFQSSKS